MSNPLRKQCAFILFCFLFAWPAIQAQKSINKISPVSEMYELIIEYQADRGSLERYYFVRNSPERRMRMKSFYQDYLSRLLSLDFGAMSVGGRVDYILTKRDFENELSKLDIESHEYEQIAHWALPGETIYSLEKQRRRGLKMDGEEVAKLLNEVKHHVHQAGKNLEQNDNQPRNLISRATSVLKGQKEALKSVYEFYEGYDPTFSWWVKKPYEELDKALTEFSMKIQEKVDKSTLPDDDGSGIIGNPIGRDALLSALKYEFIPYGPEELVDIANKEFAWCDKELLKASREMGFGEDWRAAQEKVKQSFVPPGEQPEAMLDLYNQSVKFLKDHKLLTIPPIAEETWRMSMIPPERQLISPFFLGGEVLQISYPTDVMSHEDKLMSMRGNNPHFSRSTVHHELIAGHHLQGFMNRRNHTYRRYRTPFWTEGWALYWELLLWDMDFPRGPEDRIGMLFWRMHRCARIIFSLNYHLGRWTPQQCIDFLVDRVGHERANAEGEVRRSFTANYGPLYQLAYMTGGLQFRALKEELVDSGQMSYKEFHDAVLHENSMPVEMVRAILTEQDLKENFKSSWRFYPEE